MTSIGAAAAARRTPHQGGRKNDEGFAALRECLTSAATRLIGAAALVNSIWSRIQSKQPRRMQILHYFSQPMPSAAGDEFFSRTTTRPAAAGWLASHSLNYSPGRASRTANAHAPNSP